MYVVLLPRFDFRSLDCVASFKSPIPDIYLGTSPPYLPSYSSAIGALLQFVNLSTYRSDSVTFRNGIKFVDQLGTVSRSSCRPTLRVVHLGALPNPDTAGIAVIPPKDDRITRFERNLDIMTQLKVALRGQPLLLDPSLNKGSAFTRKEREEFGLVGMLPLQSNSLEEQHARAYEQYQNHKSDLGKNTFLQSLKGWFIQDVCG